MAGTEKAEDIMGFFCDITWHKKFQIHLRMSTCVIYYNPVEQTGN